MEKIKKVPPTTNLQGLIKRNKYSTSTLKKQVLKQQLVENNKKATTRKQQQGNRKQSVASFFVSISQQQNSLNRKLINNTIEALDSLKKTNSSFWIGTIIKNKSSEIINQLEKIS